MPFRGSFSAISPCVLLTPLLMSVALAAEPTASFGSSGPVIRYVVLGDSTGAGVGGDYERGIAVATARALAAGRRVELMNLSVSGARASDVLRDQLPTAERLKPDLVLLTVTANDVTHLTPLRSIRNSIRSTVSRLRAANPEVAIVVTGSPDMGSPPRIPKLLRPVAAWRTRNINSMMESLAAEENLIFAPIAAETGPLFRKDSTLFAADRFHPNERGYETWIPVLNLALAKALGR